MFDTTKPINRFFKEISMIPRGSFHEEKISNYIVEFAKSHGYEYKQDDMFNVIIYANGTSGYEDHEALMLQGHMDMVCEKNNDCNHDFSCEPLDLYVEDGWLKAKGTTLGADDGYAISYMLAILDSNDIPHPPLVCVFTVQEEVGLFGVNHLKAEDLPAKRMIGMDSGGENITRVSSSGGRRILASKPLVEVSNNWNTFELSITGLLGGHSGGFINKERGNANKLAFRMLQALNEQIDVRLVNVVGGLKENAIPRECVVTFACNCAIKFIDKLFNKIKNDILVELEFSDPNFHYSLVQIPTKASVAYDEKSSKEAIQLIYLFPNGFKAKSMVIDGLTTISLNLGVLRINDGILTAYFSIRSPMVSAREQLANEIKVLCDILGGYCEMKSDYPGWNYEEKSSMREIMREVIQEELGLELITQAGHGGLECGVLKGLIPELDIVTFGPKCQNAHTPDEMMNIESFEKMFEVLKAFIKKL